MEEEYGHSLRHRVLFHHSSKGQFIPAVEVEEVEDKLFITKLKCIISTIDPVVVVLAAQDLGPITETLRCRKWQVVVQEEEEVDEWQVAALYQKVVE